MPDCDPWRGHLASIVFAALLAPKATDLEIWLRHAHTAVRGAGSLESSCYAQARLELLSERPPWLLSRQDIENGFPGIHEHRAPWFEHKCIDEMGRLLEQIKADGAIDVAPKGLVTL